MPELNKQDKHLEEKIKVLIENYNRNNNELELGKQEIVILNLNELKELLQEIPPSYETLNGDSIYEPDWDIETDNPITGKFLDIFDETEKIEDYNFYARIITKEFIIWRENDDTYNYIKKYDKWFILKIPFYRKDSFKLEEFTEFVTKLKEKKYLKKLTNLIVPFIFPSLLLAYFIWALFFFINTYSFNIFFMIFWCWLLILAFINLSYSLRFHYKKEKIEYYTPLLRQFKSYDISRFIILVVLCFGVIYLTLFFLSLGYTSEVVEVLELTEEQMVELGYGSLATFIISIMVWRAVVASEKIQDFLEAIARPIYYLVIAPFHIVYIYYKFIREKKIFIIHNLNSHLQEEDLDWDEKNYYLQLLIEFNKTPIIIVDNFSKLVAILTFLLSTVPAFINLYL